MFRKPPISKPLYNRYLVMQSDLIFFRERLKVIFMYFDNTKAKGDEAANREAMNKVS